MRGQICRLGVTYVSLLMNVCFKGINTTACTDQTGLDNFFHVGTMCRSAILKNTRVVVDTWGTGGPDVYSCTCTVTLDPEAPTPTATAVTVQEYPNTTPFSDCRSKLRITSRTSNGFTETGCTPIPATPVNDFWKEDMLTLTLSRTDVSKQWQSGHCILISLDIVDYNLIVTCSNATTETATTQPTSTSTKSSTNPKTTSKPTTTTPKPTTTTPKPTTTTPKPTTTTSKPTTTTSKPTTTTSVIPTITTTPAPTQPPAVSSTGDTAVESTTTGEQTGSGHTTDDIEIGIIAGAAGGGGLLLIIIIIVIVVIIRKRSPGNKQPFDSGNQNHDNTNGALSDDIQPYPTTSTNNRYVTNEGDTLTHNSLYVSAGPRDPDTNHIVAGTGDMYAQVQKPEKHSTVDATAATEKIELEETPQGDVYAVVYQPKKQNKNDETDDNRPSRYKNPDGLVYAEVGVQDMTSRPKSRVTSRPPPVSPKPKSDTENVVYAEVNTGV